MHYNNSYWGVTMIWWVIWVIMIFWIFATPYNIPGQRMKNDSPFDILRKKKILENDLSTLR